MKIIRRRKLIETTTYSLMFPRTGAPGCFFGFDCDAKGRVDTDALAKKPIAFANYQGCLDGSIAVGKPAIETFESRYWEPAVGICCCGREVDLGGFTNTCDCGRDYNGSGQELAPRELWGEETGESLADILSIA